MICLFHMVLVASLPTFVYCIVIIIRALYAQLVRSSEERLPPITTTTKLSFLLMHPASFLILVPSCLTLLRKKPAALAGSSHDVDQASSSRIKQQQYTPYQRRLLAFKVVMHHTWFQPLWQSVGLERCSNRGSSFIIFLLQPVTNNFVVRELRSDPWWGRTLSGGTFYSWSPLRKEWKPAPPFRR